MPVYAYDAVCYKFTGKERDSESGLDNFGARYNSSSLDRFMSPDDTDDDDHEDAPQALNLYSYVQNNPTNATDPDGHDCVFVVGNTAYNKTGDCSGTPNGATNVTYVPGTVDTKSGHYDPNTGTLTVSYTPYGDTGKAIAVIGDVQPTHPGPTESDKFASRMATGADNVNAFALQVGLQVAAEGVGRGIGLGVGAVRAARQASEAAEAAVDLDNISSHITRRMASRGWTKQAIVDTIKEAQEAGTTYSAVNKATGGAATEYVSQSTGKFVIVDNTTKQIIQVSGSGFKPNYMAKP